MAKRKKARKFDQAAHVRGLARATFGTPPPTRKHSSKKGDRGYNRKQGKQIPRDEGGRYDASHAKTQQILHENCCLFLENFNLFYFA